MKNKETPTLFCVINLLNLILSHVLILPFPSFPGSCSSSSPFSSSSFVSSSSSSSRGIREIPPPFWSPLPPPTDENRGVKHGGWVDA